MTAKINTSVRISTEAIENIERLASAHNWTRNQAINLVLEGKVSFPKKKEMEK